MQRCSLIMKKRKRGPDLWLLRWSDKSDSGRRIYRKRVIGTVEEFVDADSARRAVASLVEKINGDNPRISLRAITISALCSHFERCELAQGNTWRSYSTKKCYTGYLKRWVIPQWGKFELGNIKTIEVESWLRRLPLAKGNREPFAAVLRSLQSVHRKIRLLPLPSAIRSSLPRRKFPVLSPYSKIPSGDAAGSNDEVWYRSRWVRAWARGHLGGPRQCLRVDILPDVRQFAISNGNVEDPMVLERLIRGFDFPRSEADDQNPVSLRYELGGLWVRSFHLSLAF